jgi:hypothetical protein
MTTKTERQKEAQAPARLAMLAAVVIALLLLFKGEYIGAGLLIFTGWTISLASGPD